MFKLSVILLYFVYKVFCKNPIINLPNGKILGQIVKSPVNPHFSYYAYLGIPYAAPPLGKLRFQPPQPVENWSGIKNVTNNFITCHQIDREDKHSTEDCLYLSVSTPLAPSNSAKLNVLVWFYGGAFRHGHMDYGYDAGAFLMEEDIVFVSFNYRIGPFGFLSTGDTVIPGNMGLKDQQLVLKWVQSNIHLFGGDPQKVTIMGRSAGSFSVTTHLMAPGSTGLFRAVIGCSGSALFPLGNQQSVRNTAYGIAAEIDPSFTKNRTSEELLQFLQSVDVTAIINTKHKYRSFSPVMEIPHNSAIISEFIYEKVDNGHFKKVPVILGFNSEESIGSVGDLNSWIQRIKEFDENPRKLVPSDIYISDSQMQLQVGEEIKRMYVGDSTFENNPGKAVQFKSDNSFTRPIMKFSELLAKHVNVYFYQFSYHGELGGNTVPIQGIGKVAHGEDQLYFLTQFRNYSLYPASDIKTVRRYNKLFANFVKYQNPTPFKDDLLQNVTWPKISKDHFYYLDIDENLTVQENPRQFSYRKWEDIYNRSAQKRFISY